MEKLEFGVQCALRGLMQINGGAARTGRDPCDSFVIQGQTRVRVICIACLCAPEHKRILPQCSNTVRYSMPQHALHAQVNRMRPTSRLDMTGRGAAL